MRQRRETVEHPFGTMARMGRHTPERQPHPGGLPAGRRSNLARSPKQFLSTLVKVVNMQRKGSNMLDVVGSGRPAGFSLRSPMRYGIRGIVIWPLLA